MKISLIQPGRNNLKYLKWSYDSIRKNQGNHEVQICVADDASTDGTWEWCLEMMKKDENFDAICNFSKERLGHTILYDKLVNEVAKHDVCMIYHADMYLCPGAIDAIEWYLKDKTIVSLTRIEPPLHPPGPEKILVDYGIEPEEFNEDGLLEWMNTSKSERIGKTTGGIFAPWAFYKKDFQEIGGHDPIFAPQSKEDTDIFNRFQLNGIKFIQTWEGCVYHMTCRGSRFADGAQRNPDGEVVMKNRETDEWLAQNQKSTLEFIRKWGHFCKHDEYLAPVIPSKYNIAIIIESASTHLISLLEPYCDAIYADCDNSVQEYIELAQPKTSFNLSAKCKYWDKLIQQEMKDAGDLKEDVKVYIEGARFTQTEMDNISLLSEILDDSGAVGSFELGSIRVSISKLDKYEKELIVCKS
tara:strand:- start:260 stop:1498 length:1239 start_codon:yes stop_codon:yes gene_type:complete